MAKKRKVRKTHRKRRGGITNKILSNIGNTKKVMGALGVRKPLAQLGRMLKGTGLRKASSFLNR
jgi:hypothetical protein